VFRSLAEVREEKRLMIEHFPEANPDDKKRVHALIPFLQ
jgi:hypothetical protein